MGTDSTEEHETFALRSAQTNSGGVSGWGTKVCGGARHHDPWLVVNNRSLLRPRPGPAFPGRSHFSISPPQNKGFLPHNSSGRRGLQKIPFCSPGRLKRCHVYGSGRPVWVESGRALETKQESLIHQSVIEQVMCTRKPLTLADIWLVSQDGSRDFEFRVKLGVFNDER